MAVASDIKLLNFFIFNPTFYKNEGDEEKKILYYFPPKTDQDTQLRNAGLCEALIKFTGSFSSAETCESLHTEKTRQLYYQPEENFWAVMTISLPYIVKGTDGVGSVEYQNDLIQDNVFGAILKQNYKMFRLLYGTFNAILSNLNIEDAISDLRLKLNTFYNQYLSTIKLTHCDILDVYQGIPFLPLCKDTFLHVHCFVNLVETTFKCVTYSVFLLNDQLVWSGIDPLDMQIIYQYLNNTLLPSHLDLELQGGSLPRGQNSTVGHYGSFVTGPPNLQDSIVTTKKVPKVFLQNETNPESFHLVVYRALSATMCLFISESDLLTLNLFKELDSFLGPRLTSLVSEASVHCIKPSSSSISDLSPKFVYYNKLNLAQKSTVHLDTKRCGNIAVSHDVLRIAADVNADYSRPSSTGELVMKTTNDNWLVCKFSNGREFYIIVSQKKFTLREISDEVKKLCETQFKGIFLVD